MALDWISIGPTAQTKLHAAFVEKATAISPPLGSALTQVGPVWFPSREDTGLPVQLARIIVGQQLSTKAARSIWAKVEAAVAVAGVPLEMFLHEDNRSTLQLCGLSANKAKALLCIGAATAAGKLDAGRVRAMEHQARSAHLSEIWGIGQWTCDMISIFYCHDEDVWPMGDLAVQKTLKRFIGRRRPENVAKVFAPYRSILALYLWRILDSGGWPAAMV
jgi:DNA-3-methyladenine glycosylase II